MAYGFNGNTYECLKNLESYDVFDKEKVQWLKGNRIGSSVANSIIVDEDDRQLVDGLEGNTYIAMMVELGYIKQIS